MFIPRGMNPEGGVHNVPEVEPLRRRRYIASQKGKGKSYRTADTGKATEPQPKCANHD